MVNKHPYIKDGMLDPDMPTQELRLHCGELTASEVRLARAIIKWANSVIKENMVENKTVELKPCPFCGKSVKLDGSDWMGYGILCSCQIYPFNTSREAAISAWNTRATAIDPELVDEMVDVIKKAQYLKKPEGFPACNGDEICAQILQADYVGDLSLSILARLEGK